MVNELYTDIVDSCVQHYRGGVDPDEIMIVLGLAFYQHARFVAGKDAATTMEIMSQVLNDISKTVGIPQKKKTRSKCPKKTSP